MLLVGNKNDRLEKVVSTEKAKGSHLYHIFIELLPSRHLSAFADSYGIPFIETSAKSNSNIDEAFHKLTMDLVECRDGEGKSSNEKMKSSNIKFLQQNLVTQLNRCC